MDRRIGAQLYTVRDYMKTAKDFEETIRKVRAIGYEIVQVSGCPLEATEIKKILDAYGMQCVVTHRSFQELKEHTEAIMEYNRTLGCDSCGIGIAPMEYLKTADGVERFIEEMNAVADVLFENGFYFAYHNHNVEFVKFDGKTIMDRMLRGSDPEKVKFITDTYWLQMGGQDPAAFIRKHPERALYVHFKDLRLDPETPFVPEFSEIGEGNLNFKEITAACDEAGVRFALVEQDTSRRDPFESLKISYDHLKTLGFH